MSTDLEDIVAGGPDVDQIADRIEQLTDHIGKLCDERDQLRYALVQMIDRDGPVTQRIQGERRKVKVELPAVKWDSNSLRDLWQGYPSLRDKYLRVASVSVQAVPVKQLMATHTTDATLAAFINKLRSANQGRQGVPRVTVEA